MHLPVHLYLFDAQSRFGTLPVHRGDALGCSAMLEDIKGGLTQESALFGIFKEALDNEVRCKVILFPKMMRKIHVPILLPGILSRFVF